MDVNYKGFSIKFYKSRLGACTHTGYLKFNWKIVMFPKEIIDYVIVHELCHLRHFDHSKKFWKLVEIHCSDYKDKIAWIKINFNMLHWPSAKS